MGKTMASTITQLIDELAGDPDLEFLFYQDPVAVMMDLDVPHAKQKLILSGSIQEIRDEVAMEQSIEPQMVIPIKIKMK
jgi:hypothetical protein